jgi:molybdenum cofactor synthesis domain-containing protein
MRAAVLTVSDGVTAGTREDKSGDVLSERLIAAGYELVDRRVVPDERDRIAAALRELQASADLVITTGGTGFAPRDVTPEATAQVVERPTPGIDEAMRAFSIGKSPHGMLARGRSGIVNRTLIVNMPGSPRACGECFDVIAPALGHGLALLTETPTDH